MKRSVVQALLILQLNLLTLSGFHCHEGDALGAASTASASRQASSTVPPVALDWRLCPICQIMRLGAARPVSFRATERPVQYCFLAFGRTLSHVASCRPEATYGRAPPLP